MIIISACPDSGKTILCAQLRQYGINAVDGDVVLGRLGDERWRKKAKHIDFAKTIECLARTSDCDLLLSSLYHPSQLVRFSRINKDLKKDLDLSAGVICDLGDLYLTLPLIWRFLGPLKAKLVLNDAFNESYTITALGLREPLTTYMDCMVLSRQRPCI